MVHATTPSARILVIDDDENVVWFVERVLRQAGYLEIRSTTDARRVLPLFREFAPDLIVTDLRMPFLDGVNIMRQLKPRTTPGEFLPIIFLTGDPSPEARQQALAAGATDFLQKPFDSIELVLRIRNLLDLRADFVAMREQVERSREQLRDAHVEMAERLALIAEFRDSADGTLPTRVGMLAAQIAEEMGLPDDEVELVRYAAPLHDIGMITIPEILVNTGTLSLEELDLLKTHTSVGSRILSQSASPILRMAEEISLYHHENWDGTGYTPGLGGESIPLAARIVAVADTFHAMLQEKSYQAAHSVEEAVAWIESQAGRKFDPAVVQAFQRVQATTGLPLLDQPLI
jgi:putative two-component system response regulator